MKIKQGTILRIDHRRKGVFNARAMRDFDTEREEFFPVVLVSEQVIGLANEWIAGEEIPCRRSHCTISVVSKPEGKHTPQEGNGK